MTRYRNLYRIIYMLVLFLSGIVFAQSKFSTDIISVRDGLSSNLIRDIIQDQYGYIWIATNDGVNIYDGYQIKVLKNIPGDTTSLPDNNTYNLWEDTRGTVWITTEEGLSKYDRKTAAFRTFHPANISGSNKNPSYNMYEDSRNKFWVSTIEGLLEFDRDKEIFIRYDVMQSDNSVAVYVNNGGTVSENEDGELYAVCQSWGLLKFDYEASLFVVIPLKNNFNDRLSGNVGHFEALFDKENNLWLAYTNGLVKIDVNNKTGTDVTPFKKSKIIQNRFITNSASGLFIDKDNNLWVGTGRHGLYLYNLKEQKFEKLQSPSALFYSSFYEDKSGILWFGSSRGVMKHDFDKKPFETYNIAGIARDENKNTLVFSFEESAIFKNQIWLGTSSGIMLFDKENKTITQADKKLKSLSRLNNVSVNAISEHDNSTLWISTATEGLFSFNLRTGVYKNYTSKIYDNSTILHNTIHTHLFNNNGDLWVGTHRGLHILKKNENSFTLVPSFLNRRYEEKLIETIKQRRENTDPVSSIIEVGDYADISKEFVLRNDSKVILYSVGEGLPAWNMVDFGWLESSDGDTVWSAGEISESFHAGGGEKNRIAIGLLDLKAGRYKLRYKSDDSHSVQSYNTLAPEDTSYWGTQIFSVNDEEFKMLSKYLSISNQKTFLNGRDIQVIYTDSKNITWIGTDEGVAKIDSGFNIQNYLKDAGDLNSISDNSIRDIKEDLNGNIWIATSNGLNKYNPDTDNFTKLGEYDGLSSSNLKAIVIDEQGNLWVSGIKGISKIEFDDQSNNPVIVNYDVQDGLQGYEFLESASFIDNKGKIYFSGIDGFNAFFPGKSNRTPPFLAIKDIKISNKSITEREEFDFPELNHISEISLSHNQNDLSFEFASIHYSRPDKNRLMYKLEGADEDWILSKRRFASYTNLRPGNYTFSLKGSNGDGIWSDEVRKINIHISAPWYNNWVAYIVYAILFLGILYGVRRSEMGRQLKNAKIQESQLRAEAAESKAKVAEAQALVVQAENDRKTKELEEARNLQLSMLPKYLPKLPNLDIAVYMQTATEVGGDYYDFHVSLDGTLTVVVGDATGHGMKAGTMVTTAKSLFNSYAPNSDILYTFHEITRCIKQMNFDKLSMCMTMAKIKGNKLQISTAGMPPSFIFRRDTRVVEEHVFKAMPLGTMENFPYEIKDTTLNPGDTILLMSDGLPELENKSGEMYGYKRIRNGFEDVAEKAPEDIISYLKNEGASWVNNEAPDDDVTFVVIKIK
jgi:ligand-binding sensor domain-containing protein/serine phosphatase RsbU (regulator of sigma subunit)